MTPAATELTPDERMLRAAQVVSLATEILAEQGAELRFDHFSAAAELEAEKDGDREPATEELAAEMEASAVMARNQVAETVLGILPPPGGWGPREIGWRNEEADSTGTG